ncbi:MAG: hypothetical protein ACRDF4_01090 [Rhabdochlamydiaceae bacterium]
MQTPLNKDKRSNINVQGASIGVLSGDRGDYIFLIDMAKKFGGDTLIYSWMRNRNTVEFLGIWETIHNPDFRGNEFVTFKPGANRFNSLEFEGFRIRGEDLA